MLCEIYKGKTKPDTYVYLKAPAEFENMPESIRAMMGELSLVMELDIIDITKLAREKAINVLDNIDVYGFHIQLPPKDERADVL